MKLPWLKSFLQRLDLDPSSTEFDPNFDVSDRIAQLSLVYGLPAFVKLGVFQEPMHPSQYILYLAMGGDCKILRSEWLQQVRAHKERLKVLVEIHKLDEAWMQLNYVTHRNDWKLAGFYATMLHLYDPNLETPVLSRRIVKAEHVTQWEKLITIHSRNTFEAKDPVLLVDNAPAVIALITEDARLVRGDSGLLLAWSLIHRLLPLAHGQEMRKTAASKSETLEEFCYRTVSDVMALAVSKKYLNNLVPPAMLVTAARLANRVIRALYRNLRKSLWITDPVRSMALDKADVLGLVMGYPQEYANESLFEATFAGYPDVGRNFLHPYLNSLRILTHRAIRGKPTGNFKAGAVNAYFNSQHNNIIVLAGILQPPVYTRDAPNAFNYGSLGQIVGHEIMHGFDVRGIAVDYQERPVYYMATETMQTYTKKVLCLRASYQKAESDARARTLDDDIDSEGFADFAGIFLAYDAYRHLPEKRRTRTVPYVGLTAEQTFFVAHCIKWCHSDKENKMRTNNNRYWHSRSRCIVPLQNMPEFAEAFACRYGDMMNPKNRCDFW
ncbi:neprilysin-1-like [Amblyomma americanum]